MRVYEVMSKAVETVHRQVAASEARTRMRHRKIRHLVVAVTQIADAPRLFGLFCAVVTFMPS